MLKVLLYISNHGYGHATRMSALAGEFAKLGIMSVLCTDRPEDILQNTDKEYVKYRNKSIDCKVSHIDWQTPDTIEIYKNLTEFFKIKDVLIKDEVEFIKKYEISFIIADIPFLAFEIAESANIRAYAVSNFDWHEQYSGFFKDIDDPNCEIMLDYIKKAYQKADMAFVLPFSGDDEIKGMQIFPKQKKTGLLARHNIYKKNTVYEDFNIPHDKELFLISFTDKLNFSLENLLNQDSNFFLGRFDIEHPNYRKVNNDYDYMKLISSVDCVITKSGYSTLAEATQYKKAVLYMTRKNFPEDILLSAHLKKYPYAYEICFKDNTLTMPVACESHKKSKKRIPAEFRNNNSKVLQDCLSEYLSNLDRLKCIIEIGTNNILLLIVSRYETGYKTVHRASFVSGLGKKINGAYLNASAIKRTIKILDNILKTLIPGINDISIISTWVARNTANFNEISDYIKSTYDLKTHIVTSEAECRLNALATLDAFSEYQNILAFDVGGGSTEFVLIKSGKVIFEKSLELGIRTLYEKYKNFPEDSKKDHILDMLKSLNIERNMLNNCHYIGIGGVFSSIYLMIKNFKDKSKITENFQDEYEYYLKYAHKSVFSRDDLSIALNNFKINSIYKETNRYKQFQIMKLGLIIVISIMEFFDIKFITVSDRSPQFGLLNKSFDEEVLKNDR